MATGRRRDHSVTWRIPWLAGLIRLVRRERLEGDVFNLGSQEETKVVDLTNEILKVSSSQL